MDQGGQRGQQHKQCRYRCRRHARSTRSVGGEAEGSCVEVGQVMLGFCWCWRGEQAEAVAAAHILDAAAELIVAAHWLVVGLGPSTPHASPKEVTLNV